MHPQIRSDYAFAGDAVALGLQMATYHSVPKSGEDFESRCNELVRLLVRDIGNRVEIPERQAQPVRILHPPTRSIWAQASPGDSWRRALDQTATSASAPGQVAALFASPMTNVWSGGLIFSRFNASSAGLQFGMVTLSEDNTTVTTD
ncbi:hypothetical protein B0H14DRAFT_3473308 [Mycena olivaceomarginata]|nr:hypothetical protein B0H14DRAFT_3473308 [Mycena olivaceomarginata]